MRIDQVSVGTASVVELVALSGTASQLRESEGLEAALVFSVVADAVLLRVGASVWAVEARDAASAATLVGIRDRNLPRLSWLLPSRGKASTPSVALVQVHEVPAEQHLGSELDIAVDDKIVDDVRKRTNQMSTPAEVLRWLEDRFILRSGDGGARVFLGGSPTAREGEPVAFRLMGQGYAADVQKDAEERLCVVRIVEARRGGEQDERRPIVLVRGQIAFRDKTMAGAFRGAARGQLDELVARAGSYLALWREYNELERESVLRRARRMGVLGYTSARRVGPNWVFQLEDGPTLEKALDALRGFDDVDLEAAIEPPPELQAAWTAPEAGSRGAPRGSRGRVFAGTFVHASRATNSLEIRREEAHEERTPPAAGVIFLGFSGDRLRLERREEAGKLIASAECAMPQLGLLIEDSPVPARRRHAHQPLSTAARAMFGGEPTARQVEALRVALNTPDIALIQGPPGTGKTRTIAALQARLAELAEDGELSGQTLLTSYQHDAVENAADRTLVFGLPAIKVGRKRGGPEEGDGFDRWRRERIEAVRADLASQPERPVTEALNRVRALAAAYLASPTDAVGSARLLDTLADVSGRFLSPRLVDRMRSVRQGLARESLGEDDAELDARAVALTAVRALRVDAIGFGDDGPRNAARALYRLEIAGAAEEATKALLRLAANWTTEQTPPFLRELETLQGQLIDELAASEVVGVPGVNHEIEQLLPQIVDELFSRARESSGGEDAVLGAYLDDLENDAEGVRDAVRAYTVVLAATCQQSVSFEMSKLKGEDTVFANVVVDEAARANPLDLFIPMSRAERRIILVGDHRQLPHILEPDVEAQLDESVSASTTEALRRSLFQRLFETMRAREAKDGIKRTVTLDVQYRMHPVLGTFVSDTFYAGHGEAFSSGIGEGALPHRLPGYGDVVAAWKEMPLSAGAETGGQSKRRPAEAAWIAAEVERLATHRPDLSFGVISFYAAQADEILQAMEKRGMAERGDDGSRRVAAGWRETRGEDGQLKERVRVGTVDGFQGKELDVVFLSMTRSNDLRATDERSLRRKVGHLLLENRLCVAMSRQRRLLVVVGDGAMLRGEVAATALRGLVAFRSLCEGKHGLTLPA